MSSFRFPQPQLPTSFDIAEGAVAYVKTDLCSSTSYVSMMFHSFFDAWEHA